MKITDVESIVLLQPDADSEACSSSQDNIVVRIHTDAGITGIGETDANPWAVKAFIEAPGTHIMGVGLKELILGLDPLDTTALWERMYTLSAMNGRRGLGVHAMGAIDMALWDIRGKAAGKPIWKLLGGSNRRSITPYASLLPDGHTLVEYKESLVERAIGAKKMGFKAAKLELCIQGPYSHNGIQEGDEAFEEIVAACREAVGTEMVLMIDVAYCWSDVYHALSILKRLEKYNIFFAETPLPSDDLEGYRKLSQLSPIRLAAGEWLSTRYEFKALIEQGDIAVAQPDVGRVGGITEAKRVIEMAANHGRLVVPHCWKSGIGIAASIQVCAGETNVPFIEYQPAELADSLIRKTLVKRDYTLVDGRIPLPEEPGLGIELNEAALEHFRVAFPGEAATASAI